MNPMRRAVGAAPILALALAACAAPGTGGGTTDSTEPTTSAPATSLDASPGGATNDDAGAASAERVDIGVLAGDPAAFEGQAVAVLARVDEVLVDGKAFMTSPSGTDEDQFPVVITADAQVEKEIQVGSVLWLEGTPVAFTAEDLQAAGVEVSADELAGFDGEFVFVASAIADPLGQGDADAGASSDADDSGGDDSES